MLRCSIKPLDSAGAFFFLPTRLPWHTLLMVTISRFSSQTLRLSDAPAIRGAPTGTESEKYLCCEPQ